MLVLVSILFTLNATDFADQCSVLVTFGYYMTESDLADFSVVVFFYLLVKIVY